MQINTFIIIMLCIHLGTITTTSTMDSQSKKFQDLRDELKKHKARILGIMNSTLDRPIDFNPDGTKNLGTLYNPKKEYTYCIDGEPTTISYATLEKMLESDDEEFNIADIYDGKLNVSNLPQEIDPLVTKPSPQKPCCNCLSM